MSWILVTNDDGIDAQALVPMVRALDDLGLVRVIVPHTERSWIGKAITRYEPVRTERVVKEGLEMFTCSGYPADCVQLAIHSMFDGPPALVVSGINLGYNHGSAYVQSSGTVGAALEAGLSGVDGLALSAGVDGDFHRWREWALGDDSRPMWERLAAIGADLAAGMLSAGPHGITINANLPHDADPSTPRRLTTVAETGYGQMFREQAPGVYVHDYRGDLTHRSMVDGTDVDAAAEDCVSITPVRGISATGLPESLRSGLRLVPAGEQSIG